MRTQMQFMRWMSQARVLCRRHLQSLSPRLKWRSASRQVLELGPRIMEGRRALLKFGENSNGEFIALAKNLGELEARLMEAGIEAARLDATLHDRDEDRALSSAFDLFKSSVDLAHASIGIALCQEAQMAEMEGELLRNRGRFWQNSLIFQVLITNIRVESASLDPENRMVFKSVADDMGAMEKKMTGTLQSAFAAIESIVSESAAGRAELQVFEGQLNASAQESIKRLRAELERIRQGLAPCVASSEAITGMLEQTRGQTGELMTALQYQDIVRQQLEHVGEGFDDFCLHLQPGASTAGLDLVYLHQASLVQQTQLAASQASIENAGRQIGSGSRALLATSASLVSRLSEMEMAASAAFRDSRLGAMFKEETEKLVKIASMSEATNERISLLLERIEAAVRAFSVEIRRHEFDLRLIALNGQIAAVRIPHAQAVGKLAEETAHLSRETAVLTSQMTGQLEAILRSLKGVRKEADEIAGTVGKERAELERRAVEVSAKLARLNERVQRGSGAMSRRFEGAYRRFSEFLPKLKFPAVIAASFSPATKLCERLVAETAGFVGGEAGTEASVRLATHRGRYTMRQERELHAAVVNTPVDAAVFVESVELFGDEPEPPALSPEIRSNSKEEGLTKPVAPVALATATAPVPPPAASADLAAMSNVELF